jgi:thiamine biosynthesis lipoprotein
MKMHFRDLTGVFLLITASVFLISSKNPFKSSKLFLLTGKAQGTTYTIKYVYSNEVVSQKELDSVFLSFDKSLSIYNPNSLISAFNKQHKKAVLDSHLLRVMKYSDSLCVALNSTFNIKILPLLEAWGFKGRRIKNYPDSNRIKQVLKKEVYKVYIINDLEAVKSTKKLRIDVDGIAQGYCVDYLANFLLSKGIKNFIVEIGGEVYGNGTDHLGRIWRVGIQGGDYLMGNQDHEDLVLRLNNQAVTTSGKFQKYKKMGDSVISHVLDPRTGYPVKNDLVSVTVLAKNAMLADGLDNAFMVMGIKETMEWLDKNPNIGVFMVYRKKDGSLADTANGYFKNQMFNAESN